MSEDQSAWKHNTVQAGCLGRGRSLVSCLCREGLPGKQSPSSSRETNHSHFNIEESNSDTFPTQKESSAPLGLTWGGQTPLSTVPSALKNRRVFLG